MTTPLKCPGRISITFIDTNCDEAGFGLPCNTPLTVEPGSSRAVCENGHQWPVKEPIDA